MNDIGDKELLKRMSGYVLLILILPTTVVVILKEIVEALVNHGKGLGSTKKYH